MKVKKKIKLKLKDIKKKVVKKATKEKTEAKILKILFIDASVFINCAVEEVDGSSISVLEDINKNLNENKTFLILPTILKEEINKGMPLKFLSLKENIEKTFLQIESVFSKKEREKNKGKVSRVFIKAIKNSKKETIKNISIKEKEVTKVVEEILNNKNTKIIELEDGLVMAGIKRSLLQKAPYSKTDSKSAYLKDRDCIIFESILGYLKRDKIYKTKDLIFCVDDTDYTEKENEVKKDIIKDVNNICKKIKVYRNPLDMLKQEFKEKYKKVDIDKYKKEDRARSVTDIPPSSLSRVVEDWCDVDLESSFNVFGNIRKVRERAVSCPKCGEYIGQTIWRFLNTHRLYQATKFYGSGDIRCPKCDVQLNIVK